MGLKTLLGFGLAVLIVLVAVFWYFSPSNAPGQYDNFAKCLTQKGAKFYGAWWCPHCAEQKEIIGNSMKYVNYIECSLPDRSDIYQVCKDADIKGFPTWIFADGTRESIVLSLNALSQKTGCSLTGNSTTG